MAVSCLVMKTKLLELTARTLFIAGLLAFGLAALLSFALDVVPRLFVPHGETTFPPALRDGMLLWPKPVVPLHSTTG